MAALCIALLSSHGTRAQPAQSVVALTGVRVIDGTGKAPIDNATLLIENGRIAAVGAAATLRVPKGAARVPLDGKTIIPGLINAHGHVQVEANARLPVHEDLLRRLNIYASYGVTTVVSLGSSARDEAPAIELRNEQRAGRAGGARFYTAGQAVVGRTPEESRAAVDRLAKLGVDFIKLRLNGTASDPSFETFRAQVDQAHVHGLRTAVHIFSLKDAQLALDAGVDIIAHSVRDQDVTPAFIAALERRQVFYVPTLTRDLSVFVYASTPTFFTDAFFLRGAALYGEQITTLSDPARQQRVRADGNAQASKVALVQAKRNLQLLSAAGVAIAMGTDSGAAGNPGRWQGYFEHVELEMMVESGLTPLQTLIAETSAAAQALGLREQGSLERNKHADLIVLNADPLTDIKNTRQIHSVWLAGKQLDLSGIQ
jgi:imidazolonepropionase-like amidohydrolase